MVDTRYTRPLNAFRITANYCWHNMNIVAVVASTAGYGNRTDYYYDVGRSCFIVKFVFAIGTRHCLSVCLSEACLRCNFNFHLPTRPYEQQHLMSSMPTFFSPSLSFSLHGAKQRHDRWNSGSLSFEISVLLSGKTLVISWAGTVNTSCRDVTSDDVNIWRLNFRRKTNIMRRLERMEMLETIDTNFCGTTALFRRRTNEQTDATEAHTHTTQWRKAVALQNERIATALNTIRYLC